MGVAWNVAQTKQQQNNKIVLFTPQCVITGCSVQSSSAAASLVIILKNLSKSLKCVFYIHIYCDITAKVRVYFSFAK